MGENPLQIAEAIAFTREDGSSTGLGWRLGPAGIIGTCGHSTEVIGRVGYHCVALLPVELCRACACGLWDQAHEDSALAVEIDEERAPPMQHALR